MSRNRLPFPTIVAVLLALSIGRSGIAGPPPDRSLDWWSLRPLERPAVPALAAPERQLARTPIDAFILATLREHGLSHSPEADRRTLVRRLTFDVLGLPPEPELVERFVADERPDAYERLVDRLLASPAYGERWARHWLDVVHYADTHGYDKDKPRPNSWPYRDYVVRAFNDDRPWSRFVREQLAGDVLWPDTTDGVVATGFIAAGPWDFIGHAELPETKIDGKIARHLDRDDMVRTAMTSFTSMTAGCARCHDHKFDPITMEDYYSLQAVFAALDRADRPFEQSDEVANERRELLARKEALDGRRAELESRVRATAGEELALLEKRLEALERIEPSSLPAAFGYHSAIEASQDVEKWVQVDLLRRVEIDTLVLAGCHDDFNGIGAGFGFPVRFRVDIADDAAFTQGVRTVLDRTAADVPNPGVAPLEVQVGRAARSIRVTATRLAPRKDDFIFALAELGVVTPSGENAALGADVTALDSIEAGPRWGRRNLVDSQHPGVEATRFAAGLEALRGRRRELVRRAADAELAGELERVDAELGRLDERLRALPPTGVVYAGTVYTGSGSFRGTGPDGGRPREIHVLARGSVTSPQERAVPGTVDIIPGVAARFALPEDHREGARRRALADWIVDRSNPLTWRSIANRVWHYHFGRGLVDSPNDFGRMGQRPSHPALLDWLAAELRDSDGQSIKALHRLILTSAVYRQTSASRDDAARVDGANAYLWRMNRRKLEAEAVRDAVLAVCGALDRAMYGPGFRAFVLEKPEHSPHYEYHKADPAARETHRRSIYRFVVRSQPDPFMSSLDCADSSQFVAKRNETLTPLQALALLNDRFMVHMATELAARVERELDGLDAQLRRAFELAVGRDPASDELEALGEYAKRFGLAGACRVIFNLNEFVFVE